MRTPAGLWVTLTIVAACAGGDGAPSTAAVAARARERHRAERTQLAAAPDAAIVSSGSSGPHRNHDEWVPAEFKGGRGRWRDAGVYVDGAPLGVLCFGELPRTLEPTWQDDEEGLDFLPGQTGPRSRVGKVRRYRVDEYLAAAGVDVERIREVHMYGGNRWVVRIRGRAFRRHRAGILFGFGRETSGKPIPYFPADLPINTSLDRLTGIAVYIDRKAPRLVDDDTLFLDDKPVVDIPYYGEPLRGGVRVYKDDRLVTVLKRNQLDGAASLAITDASGDVHWRLMAVLEARGIATADLVEAEVIYDERRVLRLGRDRLLDLTFASAPQAHGEVLLGTEGVTAQALALYTRPGPPLVARD
jgi:hypothetical protein